VTFGAPWTIFDRRGVEALIACAQRHGFVLLDEMRWDQPEYPIAWAGKAYSFAFLAMTLDGSASGATR
jgi:hypothetical protein